MPTPSTRLLQLHFVYKNDTPDDELVVERVVPTPDLAEPLFKIVFSTRTSTGTSVTYRSYLNRQRLETYLYSILESLRVDTDPFDTLQVSSSVHPSFMYKVEEMNWEMRGTVMDVMMTAVTSDVARVRG
jgi:hypothetical protein